MDGSLLVHIWTTLLETGVGFILGTVLGAIIATFLWWLPLRPRTRSISRRPKRHAKVALGPIIIVIFGPNISSRQLQWE